MVSRPLLVVSSGIYPVFLRIALGISSLCIKVRIARIVWSGRIDELIDGIIALDLGAGLEAVLVSQLKIVLASTNAPIQPPSSTPSKRIEGDWLDAAKLTTSDGAMVHSFGYSVSLSGGHAL